MTDKGYTFSAEGARRVANATRTVESNDPLYTGPKSRRPARSDGRQEFIIARVNGFDTTSPFKVKCIEQFWSEADSEFIDIPGGRVWDGEDGNLPLVWSANPPGGDDRVVLGHRHGLDGATWFIVQGGTWVFDAKITGNATISTNRWKYSWEEQARTSTGWETSLTGRSGTTSENFAINGFEASNDGTGVQGNGVDIDGTIFTDNTGLEIQPIQGEPVVQMTSRLVDGVLMNSFYAPNAVDGACS